MLLFSEDGIVVLETVLVEEGLVADCLDVYDMVSIALSLETVALCAYQAMGSLSREARIFLY